MRNSAGTLLVLSIVLFLPALAAAENVPTGRVRVSSSPPGATVYLNDTQTPPLGATPIRRVRVPLGEQTFIFRLEGYEELRLVVNVERRGTRVNAELQPASYLDLQAGDEASFGAELVVSGLPSGRVPTRLELAPGRHLVVITRAGYEPVERWATLTRGETQVWSVELGPPTRGSVLVSADVDDAQVWFDDVDRGLAPLMLEDVPVGDHELELRAPGRRPYSVTVTVVPGEQATVAARIRQSVGELQVIGNVDGAEVRLDGESIGQLPVIKRDVMVGPHVLEVLADGYDPLHETITVEGGMRRVIGVRLEPSFGSGESAARQSVIITSDVPGARVAVNGHSLGRAPATLFNVSIGTYEIEVTAPEHQPYRTRCTVVEGGSCTRNVVLFQSPARFQVTSPVAGAELLVDGRPVGPLPYDGGLPEGQREITVRADGYHPWSRRVVTDGETSLVLEAALRPLSERLSGLLLHSGFTVPASVMALDLSLGWPSLVEARFDMGILPMVDVGIAVRTLGRLTEVEARGRYSFAPVDFIVVGGAVRAGGGGGPREVSTGFLLLEANASIHWQQRLSATLIQGIDFYSDGYPYAETDADVPAAATGRQETLAYRLGFAFDVVLWSGWSLWANLEWTAATTKTRRVLGDIFGTGREAERVAGRLGLGFVF